MIVRTALLLALVLCPSVLGAQANAPRVNPIDFAAAREEATQGQIVVLTEADVHAIKAQADYVVWSFDYRRASFEWQYKSTIIIFLAVMTMIGCGLYFSYMQFRAAKLAQTQTSIKIGKDGLEISSPVIGLLILLISMGFFYLYLANVYPITEVVGPSSSQSDARSQDR